MQDALAADVEQGAPPAVVAQAGFPDEAAALAWHEVPAEQCGFAASDAAEAPGGTLVWVLPAWPSWELERLGESPAAPGVLQGVPVAAFGVDPGGPDEFQAALGAALLPAAPALAVLPVVFLAGSPLVVRQDGFPAGHHVGLPVEVQAEHSDAHQAERLDVHRAVRRVELLAVLPELVPA